MILSRYLQGFAILSLLLTLPLQALHYSIVVPPSTSTEQTTEQAKMLRWLIPHPCRVVALEDSENLQAQCGKAQQSIDLTKDLDSLTRRGLHQLKIQKIPSQQNVLFEFPAVPLNLSMQQHLLNQAREQGLFMLSSIEAEQDLADALAQSQQRDAMHQASRLLAQAWSALEYDQYQQAASLFKQAASYATTELQASYGLALVRLRQQQGGEALELFEKLHQRHFDAPELPKHMVLAALQSLQLDKAQRYLQNIAPEQRQELQQQLQQKRAEQQFAALPVSASPEDYQQFYQQHSPLLSRCQAASLWLELAQRITPAPPAKDISKQLLTHCEDDGIRLAAIYLLRPLAATDTMLAWLQRELQASANPEQRLQLVQLYRDYLLEQAQQPDISLPQQRQWLEQANRLLPSPDIQLMLTWNSYHQQHYDTALENFRQLWQQYALTEALEGMIHSLNQLNREDEARILAMEQGLEDLLLMTLQRQMAQAPFASEQAAKIAGQILEQRPDDVDALLQQAWFRLANQQWHQAGEDFRRILKVQARHESALQGFALALARQGQFEQAYALVKQSPDATQELEQQLQHIQAQEEFSAQQYQRVIELLQSQSPRMLLNHGALPALGWSYFHRQQYQQALALFLFWFEQTQDSDSAEALLAAWQHTDPRDISIWNKLARHQSDAIRQVVANWHQQQGHAIAAAYQNSDTGSEVHNVQRAWLGYQHWFRQRRGDTSLSRSDFAQRQWLLGFTLPASNAIELQLRRDSWSPLSGPEPLQIGSFHLPLPDDAFAQSPRHRWHLDGRFMHYGEHDFGLGVSWLQGSGDIPSRWLFSALLEAEPGIFKYQQQPLPDSVLSFAGLTDPFTGEDWGRIIQSRYSWRQHYNLNTAWWLTHEIAYSRFNGHHVQRNQAAQINVAAGISDTFHGNDLSYGIFAEHQSYQHNADGLSFARGGYFSPQDMTLAGAFMRLQGNQINWWVLEAGASYYQWRTAQRNLFPARPDLQLIQAAERDNGISWQLSFEKHWLISRHWELAAAGSWVNSPGFQHWQAGVSLRYLFGQRNSLLPQHPFLLPPPEIFAVP